MHEFQLEIIIHLSNYREALAVKTGAFKTVVGAVVGHFAATCGGSL